MVMLRVMAAPDDERCGERDDARDELLGTRQVRVLRELEPSRRNKNKLPEQMLLANLLEKKRRCYQET
jgi:hypothetical protein